MDGHDYDSQDRASIAASHDKMVDWTQKYLFDFHIENTWLYALVGMFVRISYTQSDRKINIACP